MSNFVCSFNALVQAITGKESGNPIINRVERLAKRRWNRLSLHDFKELVPLINERIL